MKRKNEDESVEFWLTLLVPVLAVFLGFGLVLGNAGKLSADMLGGGAAVSHDIDLSKIKFDAPFDAPPSRVEILDGGLILEDFVDGEGEPSKSGDKVEIHYTGYLLDGVVFDSSVKRGKPIGIPIGVGRVIKGWDRGVPGMKKGGKRRLIIPADLAYGKRARGKIPSNAMLVFTLEMVSITPK